jgi:hypothetical protein
MRLRHVKPLPNFSIEQDAGKVNPIKNVERKKRWLEDLRKAVLPD